MMSGTDGAPEEFKLRFTNRSNVAASATGNAGVVVEMFKQGLAIVIVRTHLSRRWKRRPT
jgi:hypothetical protein